jgi:proteasome lid subunit RPN8/RPN11
MPAMSEILSDGEADEAMVMGGDDDMELSSPVDEQTPLMNFDLRLPGLRASESESYYNNDTFDERLPVPTTSSSVVPPTMVTKHMDSSPEDDGPRSGTCSPYSSLLSDSEYEPSSPFIRSSGSILRVTNPDLTASLVLADLGMASTDHEDSRDPFFDDDEEPVVIAHESDVEPTSPADDLIHYANWRRSIDEQRRSLVQVSSPLEKSVHSVYDTPPNSPRDVQTYRRPSMDMEDLYEEEDANEPSRSSSIRTLRVCNPDPEEPNLPVDKSPDEASDVSLAPAEIHPEEAMTIENVDEITTDGEAICDMDSLSASLTLEDQWFRSLVNSNLDYDKEDVVISYDDTLIPTPSESLVVKATEPKVSSSSSKDFNSPSLDQPTPYHPLAPATHNPTTNISPSVLSSAPATPSPSIVATVKDSPTSDSPPSKTNALSMISPDSFDLWKRVIEHVYDSDGEVPAHNGDSVQSANMGEVAPDIIEKVEIATTVMVLIEVQPSAEVTAITEMLMVEPVSQVVSKDVTTTDTVAVVGASSPGGLDFPSDATRRWQRTTSGKQMLPSETPESFTLKNGVQISDDIKKKRDELIQRANRSLSK